VNNSTQASDIKDYSDHHTAQKAQPHTSLPSIALPPPCV
jgi:hypothetical protein